MRRTAAGIAVSLLAALALGAPAASARPAGPATLRCGTPAPPEACELLDDLAAQLGPVNGLLGPVLAPLTGPALGFSGRSDQPAGVPTADVVRVSEDLLEQLDLLPGAVQGLLGPTQLGALTATLQSLVDELTAAATGEQESAGGSKPTTAKTTTPAGPSAAPRSGSTSGLGASTSTSRSPSPTSSATVPDVPVGDPLILAPLGLPDFGISQTFEPVMEPIASEATRAAQEAAYAEAVDALPQQSRKAELAVVIVLSLLLIVGAGIAHLQQERHTIAG